MRITLPPNDWTQLNTNPDEYLIQNLGAYNLHVVIADSKPSADTEYDFTIEPDHGLGNMHIAGICWGKPEGNVSIIVGVVDGA